MSHIIANNACAVANIYVNCFKKQLYVITSMHNKNVKNFKTIIKSFIEKYMLVFDYGHVKL